MTKKDINKLLVDAINSYFTKEGLTSKPKRENTRTFKVGRRHRVKYDRVMLKDSKQIKYVFKVWNIKAYIDKSDWPPHIGTFITVNNKYVFKIIDIENYYITVEDIEELNKEGNDYNV